MHTENPYRPPPAASTPLDKAAFAKLSRRTPWWIASALSLASIYGPYAIMTLYTQFYVSCDHCQKATRDLFACAPALLLMELAQRSLGITRQADWIWFSVSFAITLAWVIGLALLLRRSKLLGGIGAALSLSLGSFLAAVLLAMIRM